MHLQMSIDSPSVHPTRSLQSASQQSMSTRYTDQTHLHNIQLIQNKPQPPPHPPLPIQRLNHRHRLLLQLPHRLPRVLKTPHILHILDRVLLHLLVLRLLLQDVDQLQVLRVRADGVDDGVGEFPLGEVFAQAFVGGVFGGGEVQVVVADLEEGADGVDEGDVVSAVLVRSSCAARLLEIWRGTRTVYCCFPPA